MRFACILQDVCSHGDEQTHIYLRLNVAELLRGKFIFI